jgi:phosphoribosyl-AMP cyclohydrolase
VTGNDLLEKLDFKKGNGLLPVVVQDVNTKEVLMLAYANKEAVEKTLTTGKGTYWSRSRNELWVKGETSGHTQKVISVIADCDFDSLLYVVEQTGAVCHTGAATCFHNKLL